MIYRIVGIVASLIITSIADFPIGLSVIGPNAFSLPSSVPFTFKPIDDDILPGKVDYFNCTTFGPFSLETVTNDAEVTFTYELYSVPSQNFIERVRLLNSSNSVVASSSKTFFYYIKGDRREVTFSLRIRDYLTKDGLTLNFELVNEPSYEIVKTYSTHFYPSSDETISWLDLKQNTHTSKTLGFYSDTFSMRPLVEKIDFTHFGDYVDVDNYYRLDFTKNLIHYPSNCSFRYNSAYLLFNDKDRLFPYLSHLLTGDIRIPLSMVRNGAYIYFQFKNAFYINKRTLQISSTYRNGFVLTNDFYLPINGRSKFNGKQLYLILNGIGLDNISTTIPIRYDTSKSLVGVCTDGDYCIIGGTR